MKVHWDSGEIYVCILCVLWSQPNCQQYFVSSSGAAKGLGGADSMTVIKEHLNFCSFFKNLMNSKGEHVLTLIYV